MLHIHLDMFFSEFPLLLQAFAPFSNPTGFDAGARNMTPIGRLCKLVISRTCQYLASNADLNMFFLFKTMLNI